MHFSVINRVVPAACSPVCSVLQSAVCTGLCTRCGRENLVSAGYFHCACGRNFVSSICKLKTKILKT